MFAKVKHHRGKDLKRKQLWVFCLKDRETKETYMEAVSCRDARTLLKIIYDRVYLVHMFILIFGKLTTTSTNCQIWLEISFVSNYNLRI